MANTWGVSWGNAWAASWGDAAVPTPVADFIATPLAGTVPLAVTFTDLSTNTPTSWLWDFGDGNTSTAQNPTHTYQAAGTYTVALTATNAGGSDTKTVVGYIQSTAVRTGRHKRRTIAEPRHPVRPEPITGAGLVWLDVPEVIGAGTVENKVTGTGVSAMTVPGVAASGDVVEFSTLAMRVPGMEAAGAVQYTAFATFSTFVSTRTAVAGNGSVKQFVDPLDDLLLLGNMVYN